jgi:hypothetical protein
MSDLLSSELGWLLFVVGACFASWNLTERGTSRRAYFWISTPGTVLDLFWIAKHAPLTYSIPHDDMLAARSVIALLWLAFYGILNPGWWVFPIVTTASVIAKPKASDWYTAIGCCLLAGLWIWGRVFDQVFLPKIYDALG